MTGTRCDVANTGDRDRLASTAGMRNGAAWNRRAVGFGLVLGTMMTMGATALAGPVEIYRNDFEARTPDMSNWFGTLTFAENQSFSKFLGRYSNNSVRLKIAAPPLPPPGKNSNNGGGGGGGGGSGGGGSGGGSGGGGGDGGSGGGSGGGGGGSGGGGSGGGNSGGGTIVKRVFTLQFDFYCIDSWDGNLEAFGPDSFAVDVNGVNRFAYTFANVASAQSYPEAPTVGGRDLGWASGWADSIYRNLTVEFELLPTDTQMNIVFRDCFTLQGLSDESWGIDNVRVMYEDRVVPAPGAAALLGMAGAVAARRRRR